MVLGMKKYDEMSFYGYTSAVSCTLANTGKSEPEAQRHRKRVCVNFTGNWTMQCFSFDINPSS